MRRAFVEAELLEAATVGQAIALPKDASHHLSRVLRLAEGDEVELFDGSGTLVRARMEHGGQVVALQRSSATPPLPPLVIAQACVRGPKLEEVVRRGTELGCSGVLVFGAERSQAPAPRLERLERIAQQAARQAERAFLPAVEVVTFEDVLRLVASFEGIAAFGVVGAETPLSELLSTREPGETPKDLKSCLVVVGPEGGLSPAEQEKLAAAGAQAARLSAHVLRTETAGLAALCAAQVAAGWL